MSPLVLTLAVSLGPAVVQADEWATWRNEAFPFSICYPADIFPQRRVSDTGHAVALKSKDSAQLIAGSIEYTRETLAEPLRIEQERLTHVALIARGENWFVVSGTRVDQKLYTKAVRVGDRLIALRFRYPESLAAKYAPIVERVAECLKVPEDGLWMVPPHTAVWIPGGLEHTVRGKGELEIYVLFVEPEMLPQLPRQCCTVSVSSLFRELLIAVSRLPILYDRAGPAGRLVHTMLDELIAAPVERLHLPLPADPRLRRIADALLSQPGDRATISEWAKRVGMSERTLFRLVPQQTGLSFGRWRQQFYIMMALERLARGDAVQSVAFDLGYESSSAFITMFKKALGQPPAQYLANRREGVEGPMLPR